jgi:ankyrin repeat protein
VITKKLLDRKKDLTEQTDHNGNTPLHVAASWRMTKLPDISLPVVPFLVQANPSSPYQPDRYGSFAIHIVAAAGDLQTLKYLLQECPKCASLRDSKGMTFLHVAAKKRRREVVSHACEVLPASLLNMQDNDGNTALHLAIQSGDSEMFSSLVRNLNVLLNLPNNSGQTPRDISRSKCPTSLYFPWVILPT